MRRMEKPASVVEKNREMEFYLPLVILKKILSDEGSGAEYGLGLEKSNTEIPTSEVDRSQHYQDK